MIDTSLARASPSPDPSKNSSGMHVVTACLVAILMVSFVFTAFGENNTTKGLAMWSLTHWNLFFGSAEHIAKFLAIIVGGPWILGVYLAHRQHAWNLQVDISQTFQPINGNLRLLVVKVALENKGKVRVSRSKNEKGLNIAVLRIDQPTTRRE